MSRAKPFSLPLPIPSSRLHAYASREYVQREGRSHTPFSFPFFPSYSHFWESNMCSQNHHHHRHLFHLPLPRAGRRRARVGKTIMTFSPGESTRTEEEGRTYPHIPRSLSLHYGVPIREILLHPTTYFPYYDFRCNPNPYSRSPSFHILPQNPINVSENRSHLHSIILDPFLGGRTHLPSPHIVRIKLTGKGGILRGHPFP